MLFSFFFNSCFASSAFWVGRRTTSKRLNMVSPRWGAQRRNLGLTKLAPFGDLINPERTVVSTFRYFIISISDMPFFPSTFDSASAEAQSRHGRGAITTRPRRKRDTAEAVMRHGRGAMRQDFSIFHYFNVSLFQCFIISLFQCFIVSLFHCFNISMFQR